MKKIFDKTKVKESVRLLVILQIMNVVFSLNGVLIKCASISWEKNGLFFWKTIMILGVTVGILAVYAIMWQLILMRVKLSVAYLSKGMVVFWGLLWSVLFFGEHITWINILGAIIILSGTLLVNEHE